MHRTIIALSLLSSLCAFSAAARAEDAVLALSWEPEFCYSHATKPECQLSAQGYYGARNLVLHGLWPNSGSYCGVSAANVTYDKNSDWTKLPAVTLSTASRTLLNKYMPGTLSSLERHEWIKHGTCSGLSQQAFFDVQIRLAQQFGSAKLNKLVAGAIGSTVYKTDLLAAIDADFGVNAEQAVKLSCTGKYLTEIQIVLDTAVYSQPLVASMFGYSSDRGNCPAQIAIDAY